MRPLAVTSFLAFLTAVLGSGSEIARIDNALQHERRQNPPLSTGGTSVVVTTSTSTVHTSSEASSGSASGGSVTATSVSSTSTPSTSESSSVTTIPSSSASAATSVIVTTSTSSQDGSGGAVTSTITQTPGSRTQEVTTTFTTITDGSTIISERTSAAVVPVSTSSSVKATSSPTLNGNGDSSGTSGLSSGQKKTVIGVVVGVGGAIVLGALGVVAWRLWGKKKDAVDDDFYDPNMTKETSSGSTDNSPFKSTLDQYHNPGPITTSHNF